MNKESITVLPTKTKYVKDIIKGKKVWEFRTRMIKKYNYLYIYEPFPIAKITLLLKIDCFIKDTPKNVWKQCSKGSGISKKEFDEYYKGKKIAYAYRISKYKKVNKKLQEYNIRPPRMWLIVEDNIDWSE